MTEKRPGWVVLALVAVLWCGFWLRFVNFAIWPPGLENDEGLQGVDALNVLAGQFSMYFKEAYREPLYVYLVAPSVALFGREAFAARLPAMVAGMLTIPLTYALGAAVFARLGRDRARTIGLLAAAFTAVTLWPVIMSRTAIPNAILPPIATLTMLLFWRAWLTLPRPGLRALGPFALAGSALGVAPYTYLPSRLLPVVIGLFLAAQALSNGRNAWLRTHWRGMAVAVGVSVLVFAPLGLYYLSDPSGLWGRASHVSVFRPNVPEGNAVAAIVRTTSQAVGAFLWHGDPNWYHNAPGRPIFDPWVAVCAVIGLGVLVARARHASDLLMLVWASVMLLPGILSDDNNPNTARMVSLIPVAFFFPARGLEAIVSVARRVVPAPAIASVGAAIVTVTFVRADGALTAWATAPEAFAARSGEAVDAVLAMNLRADEPGTVFVLPISNAWPEARRYQQRSIHFLYRGPAPYAFLRIDDATTPSALQALCNGCASLYTFVWHKGPHIDADPKDLTSTLARAAGLPIIAEPRRGVDLLGFRFPEPPAFVHPDLAPMNVTFGDRLRLVGLYVAPTWTGRDLLVATAWQSEPSAGAERLSLRVLDPDGRSVAQVDKTLLGNDHLPPNRWRRGDTAVDRMIVPLPPGTPPGAYRLQAVVYGGGAPISADLGAVSVPHARTPYDPDDLDLDAESRYSNGGVRVVGFAFADEPRAARSINVTVYWRAEATDSLDQIATLRLLHRDGSVVSEVTGVVGGRYPLSQWRRGDLVAEQRTLPPPAAGSYVVALVYDGRVVASAPIDIAP